jgi:hypothetical protein
MGLVRQGEEARGLAVAFRLRVDEGDREGRPADCQPHLMSPIPQHTLRRSPGCQPEYVFQGILEAGACCRPACGEVRSGRGGTCDPPKSSRHRATSLERVPLPDDVPSLPVPALEAIGVTSVDLRDGSGEAFASPQAACRPTPSKVIRRRGSGRVFARGSIHAEVLAAILARCTVGVPTDYAPGGAHLAEPYLIANAVEGIGPGAYVFRGGELWLLRAGEFRREAGFLCLEQRLGADAAAIHFLMADLPRTLDALGVRGYRAAQLEAGIVAGRIYLGAYASRFGATGLTFYDDEVTRFFSPDAEGRAACWSSRSARARACVARKARAFPGRTGPKVSR